MKMKFDLPNGIRIHTSYHISLLRSISTKTLLIKIRKTIWQFSKRIKFRKIGDSIFKLNIRKDIASGITDEHSLLQSIKNGPNPAFLINDQRKEWIVNQFHEMCPGEEDNVIQAANQVCQHVFNLLGSGPCELGRDIDWQLDFKSGHRWNEKAFYADLRPAPFPGGYDIKIPWELSRCQHFTWLGQAYWFSDNEDYAREFCTEIKHWITHNPPQLGVNWVCTMDVAIRAVNWLWGYAFFRHSPSLTDEFHLLFYRSMLEHGRHIINNLEWSERMTGNHYLSDIVGLVYLGLLLPELKDAQAWHEFGLRELENEIFKQVYPDGVNFEDSTNYHRLTTELFLSATLLAELNGHHFSDGYIKRLEAMIDVIYSISRPDGTVGVIGDQDNGRLHRLKVWADPDQEWGDFRYLLGIASVWKNSKVWGASVGPNWEEAIWFFGEKTRVFQSQIKSFLPPEKSSVGFPDGGWYIMQNKNIHVHIKAGNNGQNGIGGHSHNDLFSFELFANAHSLISDSGTFTYTQDYSARNDFRETAAHNSVRIDETEIYPFEPENIFQLNQTGSINIANWQSNENYDFLEASHNSYKHLPQPVIHRRQFLLKKRIRIFVIRDSFTGEGKHLIENFFQINMSIDHLDSLNKHTILKHSKQELLHLFWDHEFDEIRCPQRHEYVLWST